MSFGFPKPAKGTHWLEGRKRRADRKAAEDAVMREAKQRDGYTCRWPKCEYMPKKPRIECAHLEHRGMGGNPSGDRTQRHKLITLCVVHHGMLDGPNYEIEPVTSAGTDGPVAFYRRHQETGVMEHVYTEPRRSA
jgi:hypothetical protein